MGQAAGAGLSLAATGFKMLSDKTTAEATKAGDIFKAEELEQQAQYGELKALQTGGQMTKNIDITLRNIDAVRAAAHTDPSSPTGAALLSEVEQTLTEKKNITVANIMNQVRMDEANAAYLRSAASNAVMSGNIAMVGDLFAGLAGAVKGMGGPSAPGGTQSEADLIAGGGTP